MGRRRSKILQELYAIGGRLPWWMTVPLALGAYVLLHQYAVSDPVVAANPKNAPGTALPNALREVASYAQYIVPWLILVGMLSSVLRRATRAQLFATPPDEWQPDDESQPEDQLSEESAAPTCPRCKGRMVRRTASHGRNAGTSFWGCSRFPACHGTRDVDAEEPYSLSA